VMYALLACASAPRRRMFELDRPQTPVYLSQRMDLFIEPGGAQAPRA
jgi:hypothetical protein